MRQATARHPQPHKARDRERSQPQVRRCLAQKYVVAVADRPFSRQVFRQSLRHTLSQAVMDRFATLESGEVDRPPTPGIWFQAPLTYL